MHAPIGIKKKLEQVLQTPENQIRKNAL